MMSYRMLMWLAFSSTGDINDYLKLKILEHFDSAEQNKPKNQGDR